MSQYKHHPQIALIKRYLLALGLVWTLLIVASAVWALNRNNQSILEAARITARTSFDKDQLYRAWSAEQGGVYVPITEDIQPNPYLDVPEREITTPAGRDLTLVNPAYMTRMVHELEYEQLGYSGHITSLDPIRPENAADPWETEALQTFEQGNHEVSSVETMNGHRVMRYMQALITEESCLKCHAQDGYALGDVRGGISVSVPMQPFESTAIPIRREILTGTIALWGLGLAGILFACRKFIHDIRHNIAVTESLQKSAEQYRVITATTQDGFWMLSPNGRLLDVNEAYCRMTGYTRDELLTMSVPDLKERVLYEKTLENIQRIIQKGSDIFESQHRAQDGHIIDIEVSATYVKDSGYMLCFLRDVTARKQAELASIEIAELKVRFQKEQERNALIQQIISMLSHDLRTPLTVISSSKDMLKVYYERLTTEKRLEKLETIGHQVDFAISLLEETVQLARGNLAEADFEPAPLNLDALCKVSIHEIGMAFNGRKRLVFQNIGDVGVVCVDEILVSRILMNLLSNAIKYSPEDAEIRLILEREQQHVILRVVDHGIGIQEEDQAFIFNPFYRVDKTGPVQGTGLGLSIVKDCVERHQGTIRVESSPGKGSTFVVELPIDLVPVH